MTRGSRFDIALAREMYEIGATPEAISRVVGCSADAIGFWQQRDGWRRPEGVLPWASRHLIARARLLAADGLANFEIARALGVPDNTTAGWRDKGYFTPKVVVFRKVNGACSRCGGTDFRGKKRQCSSCASKRNNERYAERSADPEWVAARLAKKREYARRKGVPSLAEIREAARIRREQAKSKGVRRGRKTVISTKAYAFSVGRLARQYATRCGVKVETARFRIRYAYDHDFKAKTIARTHRRNTERKAHIAMVDDGTLTGPAIRALFASAKQCCYCQRPMRSKDKTLDHVIPLSRGGVHSIHNAAIACHACNTGKGGRTPEEWRSGVPRQRRAA